MSSIVIILEIMTTMTDSTRFSTLLRAAAGFLILGASAAKAATIFSVSYGVAGTPITKEADPYYNQQSGLDNGQWDGISTIFHAPVTTNDPAYTLSSSLSARYYDSDPTKVGETGLLDRAALPIADPLLPQWILKHGLPPSAVGSTNSATLVNGEVVTSKASYISFIVGLDNVGSGEQVIFDGANLTVTGFTNIDSVVEIWAAVSSDNFGHAVRPNITQPPGFDTDVYSFDFAGLKYTSSQLEIRIYGVLGQDQGTFNTAIASGSFTTVPIPEPGTTTLALAMVLGMLVRRKR